ncbi:hypothetical protein BDV59DRAFT_116759 [Aspergillus ambiguus]|uniref:uncharacterized protein n=1 Tax=Aspergillus ambiguus TaxID=176160 RepID=UPI003CCDF4AF
MYRYSRCSNASPSNKSNNSGPEDWKPRGHVRRLRWYPEARHQFIQGNRRNQTKKTKQFLFNSTAKSHRNGSSRGGSSVIGCGVAVLVLTLSSPSIPIIIRLAQVAVLYTQNRNAATKRQDN